LIRKFIHVQVAERTALACHDLERETHRTLKALSHRVSMVRLEAERRIKAKLTRLLKKVTLPSN
jgi:hypothetical protein